MDEIDQALDEILRLYGSEIYRDRRRLVALLRDYLSRQSYGWRYNLLILSIESGQLERLMQQAGSLPVNLLLENHCRGFCESYQIRPDAARWVIETWIRCFELRLPPPKRRRTVGAAAPKAPPRPVQAVPAIVPRFETVAPPGAEQTSFRNGLGMDFVRIDAGSFTLGSPPHEPGRDSSETPHEVTISRSFYLQLTPVTQAQWQQVMGTAPSAHLGPQHPVEKISWDLCHLFIGVLNRSEPFRYRLPTEAEWEYAARAGQAGPYFFGQSAQTLADYAWFADNAAGGTRPVAQKRPNPWGLLDIYGNVREWCADWYAPYSDKPALDPTGPSAGSYRICRGGSWRMAAPACRSAARHLMRPGAAMDDIGFRLVLEI